MRVYMQMGVSVLIKTSDYAVGDVVEIPTREVGWPQNETREGFTGVVRSIQDDGLGWVSPPTAEEREAA